ncbi:hypothetical protein LTR56_002348 [Elasticomyces elasticus]|nr:hypothetical protein LTR56_002348 [Elasticomyces elasticus]KAK3665912.1 hypothetical protein LTR22_003231 [Elasticomyces elasticus]KAK4929384.1 hypothetical protein LTR49_003988 [Elasticomyces elasticus]KAK5764673.1 hypothetical protein LTS12_005174 [Elasticomyces elasticus]
MATKQSFEERLQACINTMLREEYPFTHTSDIVEVASRGASTIADEIISKFGAAANIFRRKRSRKEGVRPLQLMDLPAEIQNRIFEYAVSCFTQYKDKATIELQAIHSCGGLYNWTAAQPAITRVSRQVRADSLAMFHSINHFVVEIIDWTAWKLTNIGDHRASQWLEAIGPQNATAIKTITIRYCPDTLQKLGTSIDRIMTVTPFRFVATVAKLEVE